MFLFCKQVFYLANFPRFKILSFSDQCVMWEDDNQLCNKCDNGLTGLRINHEVNAKLRNDSHLRVAYDCRVISRISNFVNVADVIMRYVILTLWVFSVVSDKVTLWSINDILIWFIVAVYLKGISLNSQRMRVTGVNVTVINVTHSRH